MVHTWSLRRLLLLRRGGKRWRQFPPARWHGLEHGQRRSHFRPARGGNYRTHRQGSGLALPGIDRRVRHAVLHPHRRPGHARAEEPAQETLSGIRHRHRTRRRTDHDETHARSRQRRFDRRVEGRLSQRLVRCAPLGHGEHLQALCREPEKRRPSRRHCRAGTGDRQPLTPGKWNGFLRILRVTPEIATASENTHPWTSVTYTRVV